VLNDLSSVFFSGRSSLLSVKLKALSKAAFADTFFFVTWALPSAVLGKTFVECIIGTPSAKRLFLAVNNGEKQQRGERIEIESAGKKDSKGDWNSEKMVVLVLVRGAVVVECKASCSL
jgi:hypothetical protein